MNKIFLIVFYFIAAIASAQPGVNFFAYPQVHEIHINFYETNYYDSLTYYKEQGDLTGIEKYIGADVIINDDTITNVGIRFRGNASYNHPGTKKPVQLDFNEFVSGQEYDGMKKINLNNGYLDPSQIREKLFMDMMRNSGMAAPRVSFAAVYFNGQYIGLYKALETINKDFLSAYYNNNDGNLYKCEPNTPLTWEGNNQAAYYDNAELKINDSINDWSDFVNLIYTINFSGSNFENDLRTIFNLDPYIKAWAANVVFGNLDSYVYLPHNYYLYHNEDTDKMEWITWDASLAFGVYAFLIVPNSIDFDILYLPNNAETDRPLNFYILEDESLKQQYMGEICTFIKEEFFPAKLYPQIDSLGALIRPYVYAEPGANQMFTTTEFNGNLQYNQVSFQLIGQVPGLKDFIQKRRSSIIEQLCKYNWSCVANQEVSSESGLKIYPNPGSDVTVEMQAPNEFYTSYYDLYDVTGRKIMNWSDFSLDGVQQLQLSGLSQGMYFLKFESGCNESVNKFLIIR